MGGNNHWDLGGAGVGEGGGGVGEGSGGAGEKATVTGIVTAAGEPQVGEEEEVTL